MSCTVPLNFYQSIDGPDLLRSFPDHEGASNEWFNLLWLTSTRIRLPLATIKTLNPPLFLTKKFNWLAFCQI